jgi:hypothetical protein
MESLAFDTGTSSNKTTRLVADLVSFKNFRNWIDMFPKYKWYEDIQSTLFSYFDACHTFSQEDKLECLQKLIMELEIEKKIQRISPDSSSSKEFSDQQQEQYELKTDETLLANSKQYKAGYQAAMANFYRYYDLRPKVSTPTFILPIENEFSISEKPSKQNEDDIQKPCYDIDNVNKHKEPVKDTLVIGHIELVVFHVLEDPFVVLLESSEKMKYVLFKNVGIELGFQFELSFVELFFLSRGVESKMQSRIHLLDWLHWKCEIT